MRTPDGSGLHLGVRRMRADAALAAAPGVSAAVRHVESIEHEFRTARRRPARMAAPTGDPPRASLGALTARQHIEALVVHAPGPQVGFERGAVAQHFREIVAAGIAGVDRDAVTAGHERKRQMRTGSRRPHLRAHVRRRHGQVAVGRHQDLPRGALHGRVIVGPPRALPAPFDGTVGGAEVHGLEHDGTGQDGERGPPWQARHDHHRRQCEDGIHRDPAEATARAEHRHAGHHGWPAPRRSGR